MRTALVILLTLSWALCVAQTAQLSVTPSTQRIERDSVATVQVRLQTTTRIHASSVALSYDPLSLRCVLVQKGDFFPTGTSIFFSTIDSVNGRVSMDEALIGSGGRNGTANLAEVRFKGIHNGLATIAFVTANLRDTLNQTVGSTTTGGTIQVGPPSSVPTKGDESTSGISLSCHPNPFNSSATIIYTGGYGISIAVYNVMGQLVRILTGDHETSGRIQIVWDGRDDAGVTAPSGVYFVRLAWGNHTGAVAKIQFIK